MKIQNVEIARSEDGTSSTGSISAELMMDAPMGDPELEQSLKSLTVALTEVDVQLQEKTTECEALLATVSALSAALKESDQRFEEKALECEKLEMKLQMVTFLERGDIALVPPRLPGTTPSEQAEQSPAEDESKKETSKKKAAVTKKTTATALKGKSVRPKKPVSPEVDKKVTQVTVDAPPSGPVSVDTPPLGPVSVDDEHVDATDDDGYVGSGPRQAHFYKVIAERDKALSTVKKLTKELKHSKAKVKDLKSRVEKSTALVEISYDDESKEDCTPTVRIKSPSERSKGISWLRKSGRSERKSLASAEGGSDSFVTVVTDDEMLPERWNSKDIKSEQNYLDAIASTDADRAGGGFDKIRRSEVESIRFQL